MGKYFKQQRNKSKRIKKKSIDEIIPDMEDERLYEINGILLRGKNWKLYQSKFNDL